MQNLFNLFYLYDYYMNHYRTEEEFTEYKYLRNYVARLIEEMGTE